MSLKFIKTTLVAGAIAIASFVGQANAGVIGLALIVDGSSSISPSDWALQMVGYRNAILATIPENGSVAVSGTQFSHFPMVFLPMTTITGANKAGIANHFAVQRQLGGNTCISCGILAAYNNARGSGLVFDELIFDVSTDGFSNVGVDPDGPAGIPGTAEWAVASNVDVVNCIAIGFGRCGFEAGIGSFSVIAADFTAFEATLIAKIRQELPTPGALGLIGFGLLVLDFYRRRITS